MIVSVPEPAGLKATTLPLFLRPPTQARNIRLSAWMGMPAGTMVLQSRMVQRLRSDVSLKARPPVIDLEEDKVALASKGGTFKLQAFVRDPEVKLGDDRLEGVL
jgi:hypothetical protein